jgi:hypothetical protein
MKVEPKKTTLPELAEYIEELCAQLECMAASSGLASLAKRLELAATEARNLAAVSPKRKNSMVADHRRVRLDA